MVLSATKKPSRRARKGCRDGRRGGWVRLWRSPGVRQAAAIQARGIARRCRLERAFVEENDHCDTHALIIQRSWAPVK